MIQICVNLVVFGDVIVKVVGVGMFDQISVLVNGNCSLCWMFYDELLLILFKFEVVEIVVVLIQVFGDSYVLVVDVSDMCVVFSIDGVQVLQVL